MTTELFNPECVCNYCGRNRPQTQPEFPPTPSLAFLISLAQQGLLSNDEVQILGRIVDITASSEIPNLWSIVMEHIQVDGWVCVDDEWYCTGCKSLIKESSRLDLDRDLLIHGELKPNPVFSDDGDDRSGWEEFRREHSITGPCCCYICSP